MLIASIILVSTEQLTCILMIEMRGVLNVFYIFLEQNCVSRRRGVLQASVVFHS